MQSIIARGPPKVHGQHLRLSAPADPRGVSVFADDLNGIHVTWGDTARGQVRYTTYVNQILVSTCRSRSTDNDRVAESAPIVGRRAKPSHVIWRQICKLEQLVNLLLSTSGRRLVTGRHLL